MEFGGKWASNSFTLPLILTSCHLYTSFLSSTFYTLLHPAFPSPFCPVPPFTSSPPPFFWLLSSSLLPLAPLAPPRLCSGHSPPLKPVPRWGPRQLKAVMFAPRWSGRKWCRQFVLQRVYLMHGWAWWWGLPELIGCGCRGHRPRALCNWRA